jgi:hypothetical protein
MAAAFAAAGGPPAAADAFENLPDQIRVPTIAATMTPAGPT